jgi:hypothetical protein
MQPAAREKIFGADRRKGKFENRIGIAFTVKVGLFAA